MRRLCLLGLALAAACSDALEQTSSAGQVIAIVNSADNSVSFVSAKDLSVRTVDLQTPAGQGTTAAGRGKTVVVPLGPADSVAVINNAGLCSAGLCVRPVVVFPLATGSGATGVAIQDDSIAWVANPKLNTVTRLNFFSGATSNFPAGVYPQAVAFVKGRVFVANGNLVNGTPAGPSWLTAFACCGASPADSIPLSGTNARFLAVGDDSLLYVVNAGHATRGDGKLSIVDPVARAELEVNTLTRSVTRGPGQGLRPGGRGVSGLAIDQAARLYALDAGACTSAGVVHVLSAPPRYSETSKVVRLATRELGVQSAMAKGVLRPKSPFGAGLELLSEGMAQLYFRETRELHTLGAFDVLDLRRDLAADVGRFAGATALAEVMLKMAPPAPLPLAYDTLTGALDALAVAPPDAIDAAGVRGMWLLLGVLGFEPSLATCVRDGAAIVDGTDPVAFSVADGGVACSNCTPSPPLSRLPRQAYRDLLALNDARADLPRLDAPHAAAHRRLVARFVRHHFAETGALSALDFWERHAWTPTPSTPASSAAS